MCFKDLDHKTNPIRCTYWKRGPRTQLFVVQRRAGGSRLVRDEWRRRLRGLAVSYGEGHTVVRQATQALPDMRGDRNGDLRA